MTPPSVERQVFDNLMASQYQPVARLEAQQRAQLARLLGFAAKTLPFYAQRLSPVLRRDGTIDLSRWNEVPILRRDNVLADVAALRPTEIPPEHGSTLEFSTSGSTGRPVKVLVSQLANVISQASGWRAHTWHDLDWRQHVLAWMGDAGADSEPGVHNRGRWGPPWRPDASGRMLSVARQTPAAEVIRIARERGVAYLTGRPRSLQELASAALRAGDRLPLKAILTFGTATTADERADCDAAFGAPMLGGYASKEAGLMAYDCPVCGQMHVNSDAVLIEVVDDDDRVVPPGTLGRIVVTPLFNFAQPLIRYEQGDLGVLGTSGQCGRTLPLLRRIVGRTTDLFRFPDGQVIAPSIPVEVGRRMGAEAWQLVQTGPLAVEVRYVPRLDLPHDEAAFATAVHHLLRSDLVVTFRVLDLMPEGPGGKFQQYVSLVSKIASPEGNESPSRTR